MKRYALLLMVAASLLAGLPSCEPVQVPTRPSTEKPDGSGKDDSGKDDSGKDQPDTPGNPETPDTPVEPEGTVIYYDSLDKSPSSGAWFDQGAAFRSPEGTGVENLGYKSAYAKIVNSWSSSGYPGASGVNGIYYTQNTSRFATFHCLTTPACTGLASDSIIRKEEIPSSPDRHSASASRMRKRS